MVIFMIIAGLDVFEELIQGLGTRARTAIVAEGGMSPLVPVLLSPGTPIGIHYRMHVCSNLALSMLGPVKRSFSHKYWVVVFCPPTPAC